MHSDTLDSVQFIPPSNSDNDNATKAKQVDIKGVHHIYVLLVNHLYHYATMGQWAKRLNTYQYQRDSA